MDLLKAPVLHQPTLLLESVQEWSPLQGIREHQAGFTNTHSHRITSGPHGPSALDVNQRKCPEDPDWLVGSTASSVLA